ncbi:MAG: DUF2156 domain-containing protein [Spirochaetales bacterium]|jgi:hypothetical protein|nr:DUF2156 domain-containing protein [Spirochaetales bacterium]
MLSFYEPSAADKHLFPTDSRYRAYQYYYSFSVLWKEAVGLTIAKSDTAFYLHLDEDDCFLLPVTDDLEAAMAELEAHCRESGQRFQLECVPTKEAKALEAMGYTIEHTRNLDDYLYESEKLIKLGGRKLQAKRNHISQFERAYTYSVRHLSTQEMREECYTMASTTWLDAQESTTKEIQDELVALRNTFDNWDELGFVGMLVCVDHHLTAFTVGEIIDNDMAIVHFEKGDTSYIGIYSVINQLFCSQYLSDVKYVNRQEDAGVPGLRKAKESYRPDLMVEKYRVTRP